MVCLPAGRLTGVRILVLSDNDDLRELFGDALRLSGAEVGVARSASEALALVQQQSPHVLVGDVVRAREDSYGLLRTIKGLGLRPPRGLAISGGPQQYSRDELLRAGYDAHLNKPLTMEMLVEAVARLAGAEAPRM